MIRILLVEDHKMVREAVGLILAREPDIVVAGDACDGKSALALCRELRPNLVLVDIALPDIGGIELTRRLLAESPGLRVLALSAHLDLHFIAAALEAGAAGYVNKASGKDELLMGIRAVAAGSPYLSQNVAALLMPGDRHRDAEVAGKRLGKRETEVLVLIAEGMTSAQIAARLHIATGTVDVHRRNIMSKLDIRINNMRGNETGTPRNQNLH